MTQHRSHYLKRSALTLALGLCFAGTVYAQSSVGSVFGQAKPGDQITISNPDTGFSRQIAVGSDGKYTFSQLAPGRYVVKKAGSADRTVDVKIGTGSSVNFVSATTSESAGELGVVTVTGSAANPIDVSSVESTTVLTRQQIQKLPVSRDSTSVALLAPGTTRGSGSLFSGLASFGGASVAENGYYINGFDVTNIRNMTSYSALPFEAISEQQVKTGGYGAEYGRSLGGVINILTRRGTNTWHGGASVYWLPRGLSDKGLDVLSKDPKDNGAPLYFNSADRSDSLRYNIYGGGPVIKDRLFVFGLVQGQRLVNDNYFQNNSERRTNTSPTGMVKVDWNITSNHIVEVTGIYNKVKDNYVSYASASPYSGAHDQFQYNYTKPSGGHVLVGKYTGYLTDNFTLSAQYGELKHARSYIKGGLPGESCPSVYDGRGAGLAYLGCWPESSFGSIRPVDAKPDMDMRRGWRLDVDWRLGAHNIRAGLDSEKFTSTFTPSTYSGGVYYRYYNAPGTGKTNGVANTQQYVRVRHFYASGGSYLVKNQAAYVEDSWQVSSNWMLYLGARLETFENKNAIGQTFVKASNLWAPRLGFAWDVFGDSSFKVFGNAGRYFIPLASGINIRGSSAEDTVTDYYQFTAIDPVTGAPTLGAQLGPTSHSGSLTPPNPGTVAARNLKPMYQDEIILGMQKQLNPNWNIGMRLIHRAIKSGFDDTCDRGPIDQWAKDNKYTNFDYHSVAPCYIINPGSDVRMSLDLQDNGSLTEVTIPASYFGLPKYNRKYHALEIFFDGARTDRWSLQGSYTFSKTLGNIEGYVNTTLQQDDAGGTQDFDWRRLEDGAYGYLPNDRRHTFKLFGSLNFTSEWRVGANLLVQSGRPLNCNGFIPASLAGADLEWARAQAWSASSFYCVNPDGTSTLTSRGTAGRTPWERNIDLSLAWTPEFARKQLTLQMDVFNALNTRVPVNFVQTHDLDRAAPRFNPNYFQPSAFQSPRSVRFSARYEF